MNFRDLTNDSDEEEDKKQKPTGSFDVKPSFLVKQEKRPILVKINFI